MLCAALLLVVIAAVRSTAQTDGLIAQGFRTNESNLSTGALMSLQPDATNTVELSNTERANRLVGVVGDKAFLEVSDANSSVQVVVGGIAGALVSDLNGTVATGDRITASPIAGVGMRASQSGVIIGIAQGDLQDTQTTNRTVTDQDGRSRTVRIGLIPVQVNVAAYIIPTGESGAVPSFLQSIGNTVAGQPVSPLRIIIATTLFILLFAAVLTLLYTAVRSSLISIGRNPLSETALRKSLLQIGLVVVGLTIAGLAAIYFVLKL